MMPSPLAIDFQSLCAFLATQDEMVVAYLFGSVAQGRAHPGSDVDLALLLSANLEPDLRADRYLYLMGEIQHLLRGHKVDVVVLNTASPLLQYEVLRHGQRLYEADRQARVDSEVRAGQRYEDVRNVCLLLPGHRAANQGKRAQWTPTPCSCNIWKN